MKPFSFPTCISNGIAALVGSLLCVDPTSAATCVWNAAAGAFETPANWSGCADAAGPSTRAPGATDIALITAGNAQISVSTLVSELELAPGGLLSVVGSNLPAITITQALRLNGGATTTVLGTNQLRLNLAAGSTSELTGSTTLSNGTFVSNAGTMNLGSSASITLTLETAATLTNQAGGVIVLAGGNSRLYLTGSSALLNEPGGTLNVQGNATLGKPASSGSGAVTITNAGIFNVAGPGVLSLPNGGSGSVQLRQNHQMTVENADISCLSGQCSFAFAITPPVPASARRLHLNNAHLDLGGIATALHIPGGATLSGNGSINGSLNLTGRLQPGAAGAPPYETLAMSGNLQIALEGIVDLDLGGTTAGNFDQIISGGQLLIGSPFALDGGGRLRLNTAPTFSAVMGEPVPIISYVSFAADRGFALIESAYALDFATRLDSNALSIFPAPRLKLSDNAQLEGDSGESVITFELRLSQASTETVVARLNQSIQGTASGSEYSHFALDGSPFFNEIDPVVTFEPGQTLRTVRTKINGDTSVEGDEDFVVELGRAHLENAAFGNNRSGHLSMVGTILTDDLPDSTQYLLAAQRVGQNGVRRYSSDGLFLDTWLTENTAGASPNAGMCFAPNGDVMVTRFNSTTDGPILFSRNGAPRLRRFATGSGVQFNSHESCFYDPSGNIYIGQAGVLSSTDADVPVLKFSASGVLLDTFEVPTGERGTDWIELSSDQCTMYFTSEDGSVRRYNLCTRSSMANFVDGLEAPCFALRLRPNGELMLACRNLVYRISAQGGVLQTYTRQSLGEIDANGLFALNLDPDGLSFWTAGFVSGNLYRVDIETGAVLTSFNGGVGGVTGLAFYQELSQSDGLFGNGFEVSSMSSKLWTWPALEYRSAEPSAWGLSPYRIPSNGADDPSDHQRPR